MNVSSASTIWFRFNGYNLSNRLDAPQTGEDGTLFDYAVNRTQSRSSAGRQRRAKRIRTPMAPPYQAVVSADGGARWPRPGQIERIIGDGDSVPAELFPKLEVDADPNLNDLQKVLSR